MKEMECYHYKVDWGKDPKEKPSFASNLRIFKEREKFKNITEGVLNLEKSKRATAKDI